MRSLVLFLLVTQVIGTSITISPLGYFSRASLLAEKDFIHYQVNATSSVSILIMDSYQYNQFKNNESYTYDYNCSRLCLTSANVSCVHYVDVTYHVMEYPVYFVIQNELNKSVDVSYTLEYTEDRLLLLFGALIGAILSVIVISLGVHFIRKRCTRDQPPNYDYLVY